MLYKLIIVDDEDVIRQGLGNIVDWESLGFEVVGSFSDAEKALMYVQNNHVDVILSDIKMTFMSGIELAKYIYENMPRIKVVFISGYKEFELAQQALKYNVSYYLLKPTQIDEIYDCFERIKQDMDKQAKEISRIKDNEKKIRLYEQQISLLEEQIFLDIVLGNIPDLKEIEQILQIYNIPFENQQVEGFLFTLYIDKVPISMKYGKSNLAQFIKNMLNTTSLSKKVKCIPIHYTNNSFQVLAFNTGNTDSGKFSASFNEMCNEIIRSAGTLFKANVDIQIDSKFSTFSELKFLRQFVFANKQKHGLKLHENAGDSNYSVLHEYEKLLFSYIFEGEADKACNTFIAYIDQMAGYASETIDDVLISFFTKLNNSLQDINISLKEITGGLFQFSSIFELKTLDAKKRWSYDILSIVTKYLAENKKISKDNVIHKVNEFIKNNYHKNISLYDIAEAVYHNPVYLSRLYKEKTGINYLDFLTQVRMNKAKELLKNPKFKISKVSDMVGYKSYKYFSRLFKNYTGMSPSEYRDNYIKHKA